MPDEPKISGWLPPSAPGGNPPPRFEPRPPEPPEEATQEEPAAEPPGATGWTPRGGERDAPAGWAPPRGERDVPSGWAPPDVTSPGQPAQPAPARVPPPSPFAGPPPNAAASRLAVISLVLGIAALTLLVLSLGLSFIFSVPLSAAGWSCAQRARARLREGPEASGGGLVKAGLILGIAGTALGVAAGIVWVALIASGFSIEEFRDDLERELERQRRRQREAAVGPAGLRAAAQALLPW